MQDQIKEMSVVYGAPNPRAFLRELIECVLSGDLGRINAFNVRLVERATGQMHLKMEADLAAVVDRAKIAESTKPAKPTERTERTKSTKRSPRTKRRRSTARDKRTT